MRIEDRGTGNFSHVCAVAPGKSREKLKKVNIHLTDEALALLNLKTLGSRNLCASQLIIFAVKQLDLTNKFVFFE